MKHLDLTNPVHVAFLLMVLLMVAAILCVTFIEDIDTELISAGMVTLMLCAAAVVGTQRGTR